jgi:hypothetical protein
MRNVTFKPPAPRKLPRRIVALSLERVELEYMPRHLELTDFEWLAYTPVIHT